MAQGGSTGQYSSVPQGNPSVNYQNKKSSSGIAIFIIAVIVIVLGGAAAGGYYFYKVYLTETKYTACIEEGDDHYKNEEYEKALDSYERALDFKSDDMTASSRIEKTEKVIQELKSPYLGSWEASYAEADVDGELRTLDASDIYENFTVILKIEGKATVSLNGQESNGTWKETDTGVILDNTVNFTKEGDAIVVEDQGVKVYFVKQ